MGVSSTQNRVTLAGDGVTTSFGFPYYFFRQSDLLVYIYDTILGGVTGPDILNTDYSVTGAQNYQGLYQSGGTVNFLLYVPLATDIVVITRSPIEQQNFALLQSGTISSAAIVQQFDYVTLLIQRLTDQIARCIQVPDGMGEPFDGSLPDDIALSAGASPVVNPSGNGWVLSDTVTWNRVVVPFSGVNAPALVNHFPLFVLPAGMMLTGLAIKHSQNFAGGAITDLSMALGIVSDYFEFISGFDVFQAVADQAFDNVVMGFIGSWASPTQIYLTSTAIGGLLSGLTQGSATIYYSFEKIA